jgi:hypothetical protein
LFAVSKFTSKDAPAKVFVADPPRELNESIANIKAYATKLVTDDSKGKIKDAKRQGWKLLEVLFPIEFYELTGATPPLALQTAKPKNKWEIAKAEKLEREALAFLTPEERAKFDEDEAQIRREKEAQNALRHEVRAAKKRKRDAIEEAKLRLLEKEVTEKRLAYERTKRRRVNPEADQSNLVATVEVPFVTPDGDPVLPGDALAKLWSALATGKFVLPGTASDPVTSEIQAVLAKHLSQAETPQPSASTSQAQTPQPVASTSRADAPQPGTSRSPAKVVKTPRRQPAAGRKKAAASKEAQAQILNPPVLLSPISPKQSKGKAAARPKSGAKAKAKSQDELIAEATENTCEVIVERFVAETKTGKALKAGRKSLFNPPSKELVEAAAKASARRKGLRSAAEVEVSLADSAKNLYGEDLEELPSEKEDELLKEPAQVPVSAVEQQPRPVSRRSGQRIDSGDESDPGLQLTAEDEEEALKAAALSTLPKAAE